MRKQQMYIFARSGSEGGISMKKRILSGILALTMCFSMTPSIAWGSGMTEFSDGASGEAEKKEEFTDENYFCNG